MGPRAISSDLLAHIGLDAPPPADRSGLFAVHRPYLAAVPYDDIAVQLGECGPLDAAALTARVLSGRGGYCFELNTVLGALLRGLGFRVTHHQAVVRGEGPTNHMALVVDLDGERWLADAGLGEGFVDPLPLREGVHAICPFTYTLTREPGGTWWMGQHRWGSISGFRMAPEPSPVAAFEPHHRRLSTDPGSSFVRTLVVQRPCPDRIVCLRARTLTEVGPSVDSLRVVADAGEFADVLGGFGIRLDAARLERLWGRAVEQHEEFLARGAVA